MVLSISLALHHLSRVEVAIFSFPGRPAAQHNIVEYRMSKLILGRIVIVGIHE
jgi:hypothetical protein